MRKIKEFFVASLIGGFVVIVSVSLPFLFLNMLLNTVSLATAPLVSILSMGIALNSYAAKGLEFLIALALCFSIGVFAKTRLWKFAEEPAKRIIIGYSFFKEALSHLSAMFKKKKTFFIASALFYPWGLDNTGKFGFITRYPWKGYCICVEPSAMDPTKGTIHLLRDEMVFPLAGLSTKDIMSAAIGCGVGLELPPRNEVISLAYLISQGKRP